MSFFEKVLQIYISRWPWFLELIGEQLKISLIAVLIAGVLGMLLGIFISEHRRFAEPVMAVCNVFYTIPAIALIGLLIPLIGIGERNAIIAIVLYGIMPMVRNTYTDMTAVADQLIFGGNPDYIEREDGFQAVVKTYGYNFKDIKSIDIGLKYVALAATPRVLLMDEPFGAVDEITRRSLQEEIRKLQQELGITVVFVTHDINEALRLGSRMLVMDAGTIVQLDTTEAIRSAPANDFVRELLFGGAGRG